MCSAVAAVAALVVSGCSGGDQASETSTSTTVSVSTSTSTSTVVPPPPTSPATSLVPGVPAPVLEPFVLTLNGDTVTVSGDVAEQGLRTAVLDAIAGAVGPDATVTDTMKVNPGTIPFDAAAVGNVLTAAKPVTNFGLRRDPDKVTLTGAAPTEAAKAATETAARALFPDVNLVNDITVGP
jgi:hypothetical protein